MDPSLSQPYLASPSRTTISALKLYISLILSGVQPSSDPTTEVKIEQNTNLSVFVTTSGGNRELLPDDFALGSVGSKSGDALIEGYPVVYFSLQGANVR